MNSRIAFLFLLSLIFASFFIAQSAIVQDIENPMLAEGQDHQYSQLPTNDPEPNDNPVVADRSWKVPRGQFNIGTTIYGIIFGFLVSWGENDIISLGVQVIYLMSFIVCLQAYFGFYISCHRRVDSCCPFMPELRYNRIVFESAGGDVSFGRWVSGPFAWISEIISFLPADVYTYLEQEAYFPKRSIIHLIFMVQLLYYFGAWDCYRNNILRPEA